MSCLVPRAPRPVFWLYPPLPTWLLASGARPSLPTRYCADATDPIPGGSAITAASTIRFSFLHRINPFQASPRVFAAPSPAAARSLKWVRFFRLESAPPPQKPLWRPRNAVSLPESGFASGFVLDHDTSPGPPVNHPETTAPTPRSPTSTHHNYTLTKEDCQLFFSRQPLFRGARLDTDTGLAGKPLPRPDASGTLRSGFICFCYRGF